MCEEKKSRKKEENRMQRIVAGCMILLMLTVCSAGCLRTEEDKKGTPISFTVTAKEQIPSQLMTLIEEKKEGSFKLSYMDEKFLYIAVGYGKQETGGYSIQVPSVTLKEGQIIVETVLIGPDTQNLPKLSYPYIVIKMERREEPILFR